MGDGVNIAARLEGIAEPGAICLSEDAYRQVQGAARSRGHRSRRRPNSRTSPSRCGSIRCRSDCPRSRSRRRPSRRRRSRRALALPDKPSIAVLPFQNMSGDPEQEYFADGMVEDIITGLSRIKWLFVIARNSSFVYKGKAVDIRQVGRELGVRYVLEGGVRKAGNRLRITAQLIEAETGAHLWADQFDGALDDVFDLQDQITERVVGIVEPSLQKPEIERSRRKPPDSLDAYDLYLRALPHTVSRTPADARIAAGLLEEALKLDPNYAGAHALLAKCHQVIYLQGGLRGAGDEANRLAGIRHGRSALETGADDPTAVAVAGFVLGNLGRDMATASSAIELALSINPSSAAAHYFGATIHSLNGDTAVATAHAHPALRLSPFDAEAFQAHWALGIVALREASFDVAAAHSGKAAQANPRFPTLHVFHAISLALAGRMEEARPILQRGLESGPGFRLSGFKAFGMNAALVDRLLEGGRLLGLPE